MKSIILTIVIIITINNFLYSQSQDRLHTYIIDSAKIREYEYWRDISISLKGNIVSVDFSKKQINLYQNQKQIFSIIRFGESVKNEEGETFIFKCVDQDNKACTIYIAFTYDHRSNPTLFVQYEKKDFMYYLKTF